MKVLREVKPQKPKIDLTKRVISLSAASLTTHEAVQRLIATTIRNKQAPEKAPITKWKFKVLSRDKNGHIDTVEATGMR